MVDWIKLTKRLSLYGDTLRFFGKSILTLITIISVVFFWFIIFTYYQPYQQIAFLMVNFIRLALGLYIGGFLIHYLFYFINELVYRLQIKKVSIKIKNKKK